MLELETVISLSELMGYYRYECERVNEVKFSAEEFLTIHYDIFEMEAFHKLLKEYLEVIIEAYYDLDQTELDSEDAFYQIFEEHFEMEFLGDTCNVSVDALMIYIDTLTQHLRHAGVEEIYDLDLISIRRVADEYTLLFGD